MTESKNPFGGLNPKSLYIPISDDEQEVIERLVSASDLQVVIAGWGFINAPTVKFGDKRVSIPIRLTFNAPEVPVNVYYFDLELRTQSGIILYAERQPTLYDNKPIKVGAGITLDMVWDIALSHMNPNLVKMIKPGAKGLTSRLQDKDTKEITNTGNMDLAADEQKVLNRIKLGERKIKQHDAKKLAEAEAKAAQDKTVKKIIP